MGYVAIFSFFAVTWISLLSIGIFLSILCMQEMIALPPHTVLVGN